MGRGAWRATVHGVARSWTQLKGVSTTQGQLNSMHSMDENILVHRGQRQTRKKGQKEKMRGRDKAGEKEEGLKGEREGKTKNRGEKENCFCKLSTGVAWEPGTSLWTQARCHYLL